MALDFEQATEHGVMVSPVTDLVGGATAFTCAVWVKPESFTEQGRFWNQVRTDDDTLIRQGVLQHLASTGELDGRLSDDGITLYGGGFGTSLSTGSWQHIAMTWDGSTITGYIDGVAGGTTHSFTGSSITSVAGNHILGAYRDAADPGRLHYDGMAEDRGIWNRCLSAAEIAAIADNRLTCDHFPDGLVHYWPLDSPGDEVYETAALNDFGLRDPIAGLRAFPCGCGAPPWTEDRPNLNPPRPIIQVARGFDLGSPIVVRTSTGPTPIARWNLPPFQRIEQGATLNVGVTAFSKGGIANVQFAIAGCGYGGTSPVTVSSMTLNPQTGCYEYWTPIDADDFTSDGTFTVEATVTGTDGGVRDKDTSALGGAQNQLEQLSMRVDNSGTLTQNEAWVSESGSDITGTINNRNLPYATIEAAVSDINTAQGDVNGAIIHLEEGSYSYDCGAASYTSSAEWLTVKNADGAAKANTKIDQYAGGGAYFTKTHLLKIEGVTIDASGPGEALLRAQSGSSNSRIWICDCTLIGYGRYANEPKGAQSDWEWNNSEHPLGYSANTSAWPPYYYLTECSVTDVKIAVTRADLVRNYDVSTISDDVALMVRCIINTTCADLDNGETERHADLWQATDGQEVDNQIVFCMWNEETTLNGIMMTGYEYCRNVAIVDVHSHLVDSPEWGMPTFISVARSVDHFVVIHNTMHWEGTVDYATDYTGQARFYAGAPGAPVNVVIQNASIRANNFRRFSIREESGYTVTWDPNAFDENNFEDVGEYGGEGNENFWGLQPGTNTTNADSDLTGDGHPRSGSPLRSRQDPLLVPCDAKVRPRDTAPCAIGAYEPSMVGSLVNRPVVASLVGGGLVN